MFKRKSLHVYRQYCDNFLINILRVGIKNEKEISYFYHLWIILNISNYCCQYYFNYFKNNAIIKFSYSASSDLSITLLSHYSWLDKKLIIVILLNFLFER